MAITITLGPNGHYQVNGATNELDPSLDLVPISGATKLRRMLNETDELIVCPGVYDGLSARIALQLGFSAMYMVSLHLLYPVFWHIQDDVAIF